jgi:16S rRNA (guanine527-N7)-methyltransferase
VPAQAAIRERLSARLARLRFDFEASKIDQFVEYFYHLAKWNDQMNLTSLDVQEASEEAMDRLLVEPILASKLVPTGVFRHVDLGSGGGSPAIPLRIATGTPEVVLVESKSRKCAFLREVTRQLQLTGVVVENARFESLIGRREFDSQADLVTFRAVRADQGTWDTVKRLLKPNGTVFWFGAPSSLEAVAGLKLEATHELIASDVRENVLAILVAC